MPSSPLRQSYCTKDEMYCAIPYGDKEYIIIYNGKQIRLCRSFDTAKKFIDMENKKLK
jgi:hypothetical protein